MTGDRLGPQPEQRAARSEQRVVYYCASSLDGYIAEADGTLDWLTGYEGTAYAGRVEAGEDGYEAFYERVGALVSGSATYEFVLGHLARDVDWPYKGKPTWVLTSRDLPVPEGEGIDVRMAAGPVGRLYGEIAASAGDGDVWVVGGGNVASQFAAARLLDELRLTVVPVVLGRGKPLFERVFPAARCD